MERNIQCLECKDYFQSDGELHTHLNLFNKEQSSSIEVGITNIPPEVLNIICKTLSWRDIKNLEKALPSSLFINSCVKRDVIDSTLRRLVEQAKTALSERKEYKKECNYFISDYYFLIRNYQLLDFQTFHSLLNEDYEIIIQCLNVINKNMEILIKLKEELKEVFDWDDE